MNCTPVHTTMMACGNREVFDSALQASYTPKKCTNQLRRRSQSHSKADSGIYQRVETGKCTAESSQYGITHRVHGVT